MKQTPETFDEKIEKTKRRIEKLTARIEADTAARKQLQKELEELEAAKLIEMIRSVPESSEEIVAEFAEYLHNKAKQQRKAAVREEDTPV